jgi:YD repeat-containing protein
VLTLALSLLFSCAVQVHAAGPSITSLSSTSGPVGTSVTINGSNFGGTQGTSTVTFNGVAASPTSWGNTSIAAPVPANATPGPVVVTVGGVASNSVTFTVTPTISSISPTSGGPNTFVTISGTGFGPSVGTSTVTFNGVAGKPTSWNATSIVAPVPGNATTGPVVVTVGGTASNGVNFTFSSTGTLSGTVTRASDGTPVSGAFVQALQSGLQKGSTTTVANGSYSISGLAAGLYDLSVAANGFLPAVLSSNLVTAAGTTTVNVVLGAPAITALSPTSGPVGLSVTISGSYFGASQGPSTVTFNGTAATPTSWSNTAIVAPVPTGATTGPVVVSVAGLASGGVSFTVGTGTITGTVTSASGGAAISGALVAALQSNVVTASTTTTTTGSYTLSGLTPGTYDIRVSASGFGTSIQTGKSVSAGGSTTVNASLPSPGTLKGKVTKVDGTTAIAGASVAVLQGTDTASSATTDSTGAYSISNLSAGTYSVQVSALAYDTQTQTGVTVTTGSTTTVNFSLPGQSVVSYSYDALGRLTGTVDSQSSAVGYSYDAAGNLVSISRNLATQVSISGFTPQSGPVGTSVTINGTAFSTTPSQNTVKFNGTAATVSSATATQLVAVVPSGASTGPISVTSPSGSATSATSFTVTATNGGPTISSFTPTVGLAGAAVTITGTNFDIPANDKVKFNIRLAKVSSATSTSISTTVPTRTTSGHISVSTALGQAVSSGDFFIPPPPYTVASVGFTGRMSIGGSTPVSINTSGAIGLLLFDGSAGQQVSVQTTNSTFSGCNVGISILTPTGSTVTSNACMSNGFIGAQTLPITGTYTLLITTGSTGSFTVAVYNVVNIIGTITIGGSGVNVNFTTPGQTARLTFSGTAGQKVSVQTTTATFGSCSVGMSILNPDGSTLIWNACMGGGGFIGEHTLPTTGTYTLLISPSGPATGSLTVILYNVVDITGTITIGGSGVNVNFTTPGQTARLTFSGTAGQKVSVQTTTATFGSCSVGMSILNPNGSTLISSGCMGGGGFIGETTLPTTGTYTLLISPSGPATGSLTVILYNVVDITGTITIGGSGVNVNFTTPGQKARLTFSGTAGQKVSAHTSNSTFGSCSVGMSILNPDGSTLITSACMGANGSTLGSATLGTTGTYTLYISPSGTTTGSLSVALTSP